MLSKAQKIILYLSAIAALLLGVILIVPFRTIPGLTKELAFAVLIVEIVVKAALAIPFLGLSVYPMILKYRQIAGKFERSRVVNVMSYLPVAIYTAGLLILNINILAYPLSDLSPALWTLSFTVQLFDLAFIIVGFVLLPKFLMRLNRKLTIFFDVAIGLIMCATLIITIILTVVYHNAYGNSVEYYGTGAPYGPVLFFTYVFAVVAFVTIAILTNKMVRRDETELYINFDLQREELDEVKALAYNEAYNDILDEFEEYFDESRAEAVLEELEEVENEIEKEDLEEADQILDELDTIEKQLEGEPEIQVKEVEKEVVVVKDEEDAKRIAELEAQLAELHETHSDKLDDLKDDLEDAQEEAESAKAQAEEARVAAENAKSEAEVAKAEAEALKAEAAAIAAEAEAEAARKAALAAEKAVLVAEAKKAIKPSYMNLVNYASALEDDGVTVVANDKETQHKFYINKKLFLVLADTNVDYRVTFLAPKSKAIDLIIDNPKTVSKATSPKGPHWYKLINKGTFEGDQLKEIIKGALEQQKQLLQEAEEEKARIKAEKAAAKKAEKEAAKAE